MNLTWTRWGLVPLFALVLVVANSGFWRSQPSGAYVDHGEVSHRVDFAPGVFIDPVGPEVHPAIDAAAAFQARADQGRRPHEYGPAEVYFGALHIDGSADLGPEGVWIVVRHHVMVDLSAAVPSYAESLEAFDPVSGLPAASTMWVLP